MGEAEQFVIREFGSMLPRLAPGNFEVTSPIDVNYNCIAWAASDTGRWWEPSGLGRHHWPAGASREYTIHAYVSAFESIGYEVCDHERFEEGYTKVAVYAIGERPTHAAKQLSNEAWSSKLGKGLDITHELTAIAGSHYGWPAVYLRKPIVG